MNIALIGYGKMGKAIEKIALERKHNIVARINEDNIELLQSKDLPAIDAAIEFTQPESAFENISLCLKNNIPVVSGTTGWLDRRPAIEELCKNTNGAFFYASNFSVGVNIFFKLNKILAQLMSQHPEYKVAIEEIHHTEKKDAPSGTAITLAEGIFEKNDRLQKWVNIEDAATGELPIISLREDKVPGTHTISYNSTVDSIEIKHTAHNRDGFALGAVLAAEWLADKKGSFGMDDMLNL
jgi:4-hydroxy-tetrahydrodipicolinate reductase